MKIESVFAAGLLHLALAALITVAALAAPLLQAYAQAKAEPGGGTGPPARLIPTGATGWAKSSVNAVIFRAGSLATQGNTQFIAFYDGEGRVVLGRRRLGELRWELRTTQYSGNVKDAHNAISIGVDGSGVLHISWDMHSQALRYARAIAPGSLELGAEETMTGAGEARVTYPQFTALPDGGLLFLYREGSSGDGDVMLNRYDLKSRKWKAVARPLIDGEGARNAYVNGLAVDSRGGWHLSWVWRETPDVATNHDICYAASDDEGKTWHNSSGQKYALPITAATAEIAWPVPPNSELINQTSMTVDQSGRPLIATYWRDPNSLVPQFRLVWHDGKGWRQSPVGRRTQPFRLSGGGTKRIPISRPQVLAGKNGSVHVLFRDEERGNGISMATSTDAERAQWKVVELLKEPVGAWEPTLDASLWQNQGKLGLFVQRVGQGDAETLESIEPQPVGVLEWTP